MLNVIKLLGSILRCGFSFVYSNLGMCAKYFFLFAIHGIQSIIGGKRKSNMQSNFENFEGIQVRSPRSVFEIIVSEANMFEILLL